MTDPITLILGDCIEEMAKLPAESVDAVVTDPPAGIGFMNKDWDHHKGGREAWVAWMTAVMRECYRLLKPGGHAVVWALPRTSHWTGWALEDAGFEMRDKLIHAFASGFPKSLNLPGGYGTALKPAYEDWWLARKPLRGTVAANMQAYGVGALNIAATRIGVEPRYNAPAAHANGSVPYGPPANEEYPGTSVLGRWPANLILTDPIFDGDIPGVVGDGTSESGLMHPTETYGDSGTYSRFFLVPKASRSDREPLLGGLPEGNVHPPGSKDGRVWDIPGSHSKHRQNVHPTVKPLELMRHLVRLVTPPGGLVLDPFLGSGTTAIACQEEGFRCIGIEKEPEYMRIAEARLNGRQVGLGLDVPAATKARQDKRVDPRGVARTRDDARIWDFFHPEDVA